MDDNQPRNPIYKRWWFWLGAVLIIGMIIGWVIGNTYEHYQEHLSTIKSQISSSKP